MYLFVYKNWKHKLNRYDPRKKNLHSTYGQFRLDVIRGGLKGNYTLYGCGEHPFHKALNSFCIEDHPLLGHVIEIKDPKLAVWLKLSYDLIAKDSIVQFVASYGPFESESIFDEMIKTRRQLCNNLSSVLDQRRINENFSSSIHNYTTTSSSNKFKDSTPESLISTSKGLYTGVKELSKSLLETEKNLREELRKLQNSFLSVFESKKLT